MKGSSEDTTPRPYPLGWNIQPMSIARLLENGDRVDDVRPKALKMQIKREIAEGSQDLGNLPLPKS